MRHCQTPRNRRKVGGLSNGPNDARQPAGACEGTPTIRGNRKRRYPKRPRSVGLRSPQHRRTRGPCPINTIRQKAVARSFPGCQQGRSALRGCLHFIRSRVSIPITLPHSPGIARDRSIGYAELMPEKKCPIGYFVERALRGAGISFARPQGRRCAVLRTREAV